MVHRFDDLETFRHRGQVIPGVLLRVDVLEQQPDVFPFHELRRAFQAVDAALVLDRARHARHDVARHDDDRRAFELLHDGELVFEIGQQGFARAGVADAVGQSRRGVKRDAELPALGVGSAEIVFRPFLVLAYQLDVLVARFRDVFQPLLERKSLEHGPEHDRQVKRDARRFSLRCCHFRRACSGHRRLAERSGSQGSSGEASCKIASVHFFSPRTTHHSFFETPMLHIRGRDASNVSPFSARTAAL